MKAKRKESRLYSNFNRPTEQEEGFNGSIDPLGGFQAFSFLG